MSTGNDLLAERLKKAGYSVTKPRQTVFGTLHKTGPLTMAELIQKSIDGTDRASVYRTVELFEKLGIVIRLNQGWKYKLELSDLFTPHHHHLSCEGCGAHIDIDEPERLDQTLRELAEQKGFLARSHQLEIMGLCATCRAKTI